MKTPTDNNYIKHIIAISIFTAMGTYLAFIVPTTEIAWVCGILLLTIYLFAFEVVDVDVAAISIMVLLGLTSLLAPIMGIENPLVDSKSLFDGFASNAVMSIIAVMVIGSGLDKTGIMSKVAGFILKIGGTTEKRIIPIISSTVGFISSFMQNVGAAALFLPVVSRISARSGLPMSRLLMPMGFTAILGGTVTMVGSSPLILLNDLILTSNKALAEPQQMETFGLFSVTPIGIALVLTGIIYFMIAGRFVLPNNTDKTKSTTSDTNQHFHDVYGLDYKLYELFIDNNSTLIGKSLHDIEHDYKIRIIASKIDNKEEKHINNAEIARNMDLCAGMTIGVIASPDNAEHFANIFELKLNKKLKVFANTLSLMKSGIAELVIPAGSQLIAKSAKDIWMRKTYGLALIGLHRNTETLCEGDNIRNIPLQSGDTLIVHTEWISLERLESDRNFVIVTTEYPHEEKTRPNKLRWAGLFFAIALSLVLFTDLRLSIALLTGAIGMILSRVLTIDEAYQAISWKTVFLLASLIPLGLAVETTGTAKWIADQVLLVVSGAPIWIIQLAIAMLATFFTLVMSNVGATVLLVPLAVNIAVGVNADPAIFALTVAIATSNSFLIPTHQVNALIMGPGGYRVPDFMKAGSIMTILFLIVMITMMNLVF
jgi:di/tricarboxylate transporter